MAHSAAASRACKGCSQLKVRCQPSTSGDTSSCERCLHAGRPCIRADKRRRPRDRIAELEAQVAALSRALKNQQLSSSRGSNGTSVASDDRGTSSSPGDTTSTGPSSVSVTSRNAYSFSSDRPVGETAIAFLDARVSLDVQHKALDLYVKRFWPLVPAFSLDTANDLGMMRQDKPVLFFSIITFTTPASLLSKDGSASSLIRSELLREAMCMFAVELISKPNRRLDTVWSLLVACFWFRAQHGSAHVTVHQLTQMATSMAIDLGIGGAHVPAAPGSSSTQTFQTAQSTNSPSTATTTTTSESIASSVMECGSPSSPNSAPACPYGAKVDAERAWLACFMSASILAIGIRRPDTSAQWTPHHDQCLEDLGRAAAYSTGDASLFLHMVRGERLCQQVVDAVHLCEPAVAWDLTTPEAQHTTTAMQTAIDNWTAETTTQLATNSLGGPHYKILLFFRYSAVIYLHEPALHTPTNKLTFGAPFRRAKLAEDDIAAPAIVTGKHVAALYALKDACLALLDLATTLDDDIGDDSLTAFLADCPLSFVGKLFHAFFVLGKLHIAVTAEGNTYGNILRPAELRFGQYPARLLALAKAVEGRNPGSFHFKILACGAGAGEWFKEYEAARAKGLSAQTTKDIPTQSVDTLPSTHLSDHDLDGLYLFDASTASSSDDDMAAYLAATYGQGSTDTGGFDVDASQWQVLDRYLNSFNAPP